MLTYPPSFDQVATKRVKHAIKSDIPCVSDPVSKLLHIGKATVDKLMDLRGAAREEGFEIGIPDELNKVDKVGQFQQLVEMCEMNSDLKNKVRCHPGGDLEKGKALLMNKLVNVWSVRRRQTMIMSSFLLTILYFRSGTF